MEIRKATLEDFEELYEIGLNTKELRVSKEEVFMDEADFKWHITNDNGLFLVAEEEKIIGFICANRKDVNKDVKNRYACLVYMAVIPEYRKKGVATQLYSECISKLKEFGITHVYGWVDANSEPIQEFMKKQGYAEGEKCIWMDKKL